MYDIDKNRELLQSSFETLLKKIGPVPIGKSHHFPYGWRKSAKGRTVWRILEEIITQNLEKYHSELEITEVVPAESEVGVYDFKLKFSHTHDYIFVNVKSAVKGGRTNKDDLSKALSLVDFFHNDLNRQLFIATFEINFLEDMTIDFTKVYVMPITWVPDIYVNPSNNGNLQSAKYKKLETAIKRTNEEFYDLLKKEIDFAMTKKMKKI